VSEILSKWETHPKTFYLRFNKHKISMTVHAKLNDSPDVLQLDKNWIQMDGKNGNTK